MANLMTDSQFGKAFFKMIAYLVVLTAFLMFLGAVIGGPMDDKLRDQASNLTQVIVADRTQPVGTLNVGEIAEQEPTQVADAAPKSGQEVYDTTCFICHATGITGAPKPGDVENWKPRIEKGLEVLYANAIKGFTGEEGIMPPKGGHLQLSDDEVKAAIDYLVSLVQ